MPPQRTDTGPQLPTAVREALSNPILPTNDADRETAMARVVERVAIIGDLALMHPVDRVLYYNFLCTSLGLNPLTRPFEYISLNGKLTLYPRRDTTDQLRVRRGVTIDRVERQHDTENDLAIVTTWGHTPDGRQDQAQGIVFIGGLRAEGLANAWMKAETKSKRRLTLSLVGLGMLDETEVADTPGAFRVEVDPDDGTIKQLPRPEGATQADRVRSALEASDGAQGDDRVPEGDELERWLRGTHAAMRTRTQGDIHEELRRVAATAVDLGERSLNELTLIEWRRVANAIASLPVVQQPGDGGTPSGASTPPPAQDHPGQADGGTVAAASSAEPPPASESQPHADGETVAPAVTEAGGVPTAAPSDSSEAADEPSPGEERTAERGDNAASPLRALLRDPSADTLIAFARDVLGKDDSVALDQLTEDDWDEVIANAVDEEDQWAALYQALPSAVKAQLRSKRQHPRGRADRGTTETPPNRPNAEQLRAAMGGGTDG